MRVAQTTPVDLFVEEVVLCHQEVGCIPHMGRGFVDPGVEPGAEGGKTLLSVLHENWNLVQHSQVKMEKHLPLTGTG